jgi:hypothetical protein
VSLAAAGTLPRKAHDAAGRDERSDACHAEFDGFFDEPIHFVAARDALRERDPIRRLHIYGRERADLDQRAAAPDVDEPRAVLSAAAVEQRQRVAGGEAKHLDVASDFVR